MYGFGPQLATGLIKMGAPYKYGVMADRDWSDAAKKVDSLVMDIYTMIGAHPGDVDRLLAMIDALEQDYKQLKLSPELKKAMKKDLEQMLALKKDLEKTKGLIKEYENKYMEASKKAQAKQGNTETKKEKKYNNRKDINKEWEKNKIDV